MSHVLRADAQENRDQVLAAARELFARSGLDVPMRDIARRAGVGPATLYRRFPTKQALVEEAFQHELRACRSIVRRAAREDDPWIGFCTLIERISVLNARNQGFTDAFVATFPEAVDLGRHRALMLHEVARLADRAIAAGALRADFVLDDFVLVLLAGRGLTASVEDRVAAARRFAALAIEGFRASASNGPLPRGARLARPMLQTPVRPAPRAPEESSAEPGAAGRGRT